MISGLRFSGLASGMDTETIVKKLMDAERLPLNKMMQKKQTQEWQRDAYRETNTMLLGLRTSMEKLRLQSTFTQSKVSSTDTAKVDVSKVGNPSLSSYNITSVELAEPAQPASVKFAAVDDPSLTDANTQLGTGNGFSFTIGNGTSSKPITVADTDTINSVITKINTESGTTGVVASYSETEKKLIFTSTKTGDSANIVVSGAPTDGANVATNVLKIVNGSIDTVPVLNTDTYGSNGTVVYGEDGDNARITINGTQIESATNTFTYDGLKFTLKEAFATGSGSVTINKETDTDAIFNDIKTFVDKYNEVIASLNGKIDEKKYRDFNPLLAEQKEAMKDKEIEIWEEKAKSGLLRNDSMISNVLVKMRNSLTNMVSGVNSSFDTLSEIGIKTSDNYKDNGKLVIDETKLKAAITNNLDDVKTFFTKTSSDTGTTVTNTTKYNESGIGWRIYDQLNASMKELTAKAGSSTTVDNSLLGKSIGNIGDQINAFEDRLTQIENRYWRQFTEMEKAISKANSQSGWLSQQFSGG